MTVMTETELKESFGVRVKLPVGLINYRYYQEAVRGIEVEIKKEIFPKNRQKLFKIRKDINKILNEL